MRGVYKRTKQNLINLSISHKGHIHSEATKKKMSISFKGRIGFWKGKNFSEEHKKKIGIALRGKYCGDKNHLWKGGISSINKRLRKSSQFKEWRKSVFVRDNYTCQNCKKVGDELHPHHIKSFSLFPELRFDINNGITLCKECYKLTDNYAKYIRIRE